MNCIRKSASLRTLAVVTTTAFLLTASIASAQDYAPPAYSPEQLNNLVSRIALYPDPLLAQALAAATFPDQIADAASFADANRNLTGPDLANAMTDANLPFDPSVQALIPFRSVLDMMASDMNWTSALGDAVLAQRSDVMDAVQRMRQTAANYGYLSSNAEMRVVPDAGAIEILPVNPNYVYVPVYDPLLVYAAPRPGFFIGGAIRFPFGFSIGAAFGGWGWGGGFYWPSHTVIVHNVVWGRTWANRGVYMHNYGNWNNGRWASTTINRNVTNYNRNVTANNRTVDRAVPAIVNRPAMNPQQFNRQEVNRQDVNRQQVNRPDFNRQNFNRPAPPAYERPAVQRPQMERPAPPPQHFNAQPRSQENNFSRGSGAHGRR